MKLCPFISHILGEESSSILTVDSPKPRKKPKSKKKSTSKSDEVVILGYDPSDGTAIKMETLPSTATQGPHTSHLFCLKEPCRFYQKKNDECVFDLMLSMLINTEKEEKPDPKIQAKSAAKIIKELEKVWKFQTKSVSELIAQTGEIESKQSKSLDALKKDIEKNLRKILEDIKSPSKHGNKKDFEELNQRIEDLQAGLAQREESTENFSTMLSDMVINLEDSLKEVSKKTDRFSKSLEDMKTSFPGNESIRQTIETVLTGMFKESGKPAEGEETYAAKEKLDAILQTFRDFEDKISLWQPDMYERISDIWKKHKDWEKRLDDLAAGQIQLLEFFKAEKNRRDEEWARANKKEAKTLNNLGVTSFHNGAFEMAKDQFEKAIQLDPNFAEAYNNLGLACTEMHREGEATEAFKKAIELNPDIHAAYSNLGYLLHKQGSYEEAIEMYNEALGRNSNSSSAYTNLGNAYYKLGRQDEARRAWEKALELDPGSEKASLYLKRLQSEKR